MTEFLYWGQVQQRLTDHVVKTGSVYSFFDAVRALWDEGAAVQADAIPRVSFEPWDCTDAEEFHRLYAGVPVPLDLFYGDFQKNLSAAKSSEPIITPEIVPLRIASDQAIGLHHHGFFEIDYVMSGHASLETKGQSCPLSQGEFCFLSPGLRHDVLAGRGSVVISITIPGVTVESTLFRLLSRDSVLSDFFHTALNGGRAGHLILSVTGERAVREIIRDLFHGWFYQPDYAREIAPSYLAILFARILRECGDRGERHPGGRESQQTRLIVSVLQYIQAHYRDTSLGETAEHFGYEASYLGKQIKAATGKNYTDIVRELRISEAKRLLRTTALTMDEVADAVGYESRVQFFRSFRAGTGTTPGEYRKRKTGA